MYNAGITPNKMFLIYIRVELMFIAFAHIIEKKNKNKNISLE